MATDALSGIDRLGRILGARGQLFRLVVVGGAALRLRGIIDRPTEDVDIIATIDPDGGHLVPAGRPLPIDWVIAQDGAPDWDTQVRKAADDVRHRG